MPAYKHALTILAGIFQRELYALALPDGSLLRGAMPERLLQVTESPGWQDIIGRYVGRAG